jgi:hypothetical protein
MLCTLIFFSMQVNIKTSFPGTFLLFDSLLPALYVSPLMWQWPGVCLLALSLPLELVLRGQENWRSFHNAHLLCASRSVGAEGVEDAERRKQDPLGLYHCLSARLWAPLPLSQGGWNKTSIMAALVRKHQTPQRPHLLFVMALQNGYFNLHFTNAAKTVEAQGPAWSKSHRWWVAGQVLDSDSVSLQCPRTF